VPSILFNMHDKSSERDGKIIFVFIKLHVIIVKMISLILHRTAAQNHLAHWPTHVYVN
jgi:hypothetical protein